MKAVNIIAVYSADGERLLLCRRRKEPYAGRSNLVGGKLEPGEDGLAAAYRELAEETGITADDIALTHVMDYLYYMYDIRLEVYAGQLRHDVAVYGEENELYWSGLTENFFDAAQFAGEGNLGHVLATIERCRERIFKP